MNYCGIDNGVSGALAFLAYGGFEAGVMPLQKTRKGNEVDALKVLDILSRWTTKGEMTVVIEEPGGSKSAKAATSMAGSFHCLRTIVELLHLRIIRVTPQQWQKPFLKCKAGDTKPVALQMARSLYPAFSFLATDKCRVPHDGIVDAVLIATWAHRNNL